MSQHPGRPEPDLDGDANPGAAGTKQEPHFQSGSLPGAMRAKSLLNIAPELADPEATYFLGDQPMKVQELQERLKLSATPEWLKLAAKVLREAHNDDALYLLGLKTISDHLDEMAEDLGPTREEFWRWFVEAWGDHQRQTIL